MGSSFGGQPRDLLARSGPPFPRTLAVSLAPYQVIKTRLRDLDLNFFDLDDPSLSVLELYGEVF